MGKIAQVEPNSGDMFAMVARSASGRPSRPSPKNSTNLSTTPFLRRISVTVSTRSVAVVPAGSAAAELEADDLRDEHRDRLAEHRGFGLDSPDSPSEDSEAVDHRGVRVGTDQRVRIGELAAAGLVGEHHAGEPLDIHLVHDAGIGRHDFEVAERGLPPAQEHVALAIASEFDFDCCAAASPRRRIRRPAPSDR